MTKVFQVNETTDVILNERDSKFQIAIQFRNDDNESIKEVRRPTSTFNTEAEALAWAKKELK